MTFDPMLADGFVVTRRVETVGANGRSTVTPTVIPNLIGVITQESPDELMRNTDLQNVPRKIFGASVFAVRNAVSGQQPDIVTWNGSDYVVKEVLPYSRFGAGTYEWIAETQQAIDVPQ
jgi:hypothetical protein